MLLTKMSEVHEQSLVLLDSFDRMCKANGIKYSLAYGALIGYARHKDLIPWDDDIDVILLREDYDKLLSIPESTIESGFKIIKPIEEDCFFDFIPRYVSTDNIAERTDFVKSNNEKAYSEIGIDLFVLDNAYRGIKQNIRVKKLLLLYLQAIKYRNLVSIGRFGKFKKKLSQIVSGRKKLLKIFQQYEKISIENKNDDGIVFVSNTIPSDLYQTFPKEWFTDLIELEIKGHEYPAPREYAKCLTKIYGNYLELPPEKERVPQHFKLELDEKY